MRKAAYKLPMHRSNLIPHFLVILTCGFTFTHAQYNTTYQNRLVLIWNERLGISRALHCHQSGF